MYINLETIEQALKHLQHVHTFLLVTFLTCKRGKLPVGRLADFPLGARDRETLNEFYKPAPESRFFFGSRPLEYEARHGLIMSIPVQVHRNLGQRPSRTFYCTPVIKISGDGLRDM